VINGITKDHIRGYISEPKYRKSELAAMSNTATQNSAGTGANDTGEMKKRLQLLQ
jgi:hypothetical protein